MTQVKTKRDAENPFASLTPANMSKYAGRVIAIDVNSGKIVANAKTAKELREVMQQNHRDTTYARLCLPLKTK